MKIKLSNKEIRKILDIESPEFPKYVTIILNLSNRYAQGTRPKVVGQMSELIKEFDGKTIKQWEKWYLEINPEAIENATNKILEMVANLKNVVNKIDKEMVYKWAKDLVIIKTFLGFKFQEAILKRGAELKGTNYRISPPADESKGIDGYIGNTPVSIKPITYKTQEHLPESIAAKIIYYGKIKTGLEVDYGEIM